MKKEATKTKLKAKFFFYEDFAELLKNLDDKEAGEYIKLLLNYVFEGKEEKELNKNNATIMYNLAKLNVKREELQASKNRKHFTFYREYYNIMEILEDEKSGKLIKKICSYMFDRNLIKEEDCADILCYFNPMKISLDKSKKKSMATKSRKEIVKTKEPKENLSAPIKAITLQDIRDKFPKLSGYLSENNSILQDVDLNKLNNYLERNPLKQEGLIYRVISEFRNIKGISKT